jgi:hypothetical protein
MKQMTLPGSRARNVERREPVSAGMNVFIPGIRLKSLNQSFRVASRGAMFAMRAAAKRQRGQVCMVLQSRFGAPPPPPLLVTITRVAPAELDDDNLAGSAKHVRDGVADWLGVDDRTKRSGVVWRYAQAKDGRTYGVAIRVEAIDE